MQRITIICKTDSNPLAEITELLSDRQINIEGFEFNQFGEQACLSIAISDADYDKSLSLLVGQGHKAVPNDVVLIRGNNRPGELAEVARTLADAGVQVRSMTLMDVQSDSGLIAIATDKNDLVRDCFSERLIN